MFFLSIILSVIILIYFVAMPFLLYFGKISTAELVTFLGVIPLGAVAIFQEHIKRFLFSPKLSIEFELNEPYCSKTPFFISWKEEGAIEYSQFPTEAYYFRLGIKNVGKTQAKVCEVFLADLREFKGRKWKRVGYFQQVNLKWDRGKPQEDSNA